MSVIGTAYIDVEARTDGMEKGLLGKMGGIAKAAAGAFAAGFVIKEGFNFAKGLVADAEEAQKVAKQTEAVIRSTGGAARASADDIAGLAGAISRKTGIDDEAIQSGENLLLTFTNVQNRAGEGNDIFNRATKTMVDMGAAMGTGASGSAIQLGKALNDPIKGIAALSRVGVTFTDQQKEQIKAMQEAGDTAGAQRIILDELAKEFGGSAEAQATASGKLSVAWGNLREDLGARLLPVVEKVGTFMADFLPRAMEAVGPVLDRVGAAIAGVVADVAPLVQQAIAGVQAFIATLTTGFTEDEGTPIERFALIIREQVIPVVQEVVGWIQDHLQVVLIALAAAFLAVTSPVTLVVAALVAAYTQSETFRDVVQAVVEKVTQVFGDLVAAVQERMGAFQEAITHVINFVQGAWQVFGDEIVNIARTQWQMVQGIVEAAVKIVQGVIDTVLAVINGDWGAAWEGIKQVFAGVWDAIVALLRGIGGTVLQLIEAALSLWRVAWDAAWDAISSKVSGTLDSVVTFITGLPARVATAASGAFDAVKTAASSAVDGAVGFFTGMPARIGAAATSIATAAAGIGSRIISGIGSGLSSAVGFASDLASNVGGAIRGAINGLITRLNNAIPNSLSWGPFNIDVPDNPFPHLADSGIVRARPGGTFALLAERGQDEVVAPLHTLTKVVADAIRQAGTTTGAAVVAPQVTIGPNYITEPVDLELLLRQARFHLTPGGFAA